MTESKARAYLVQTARKYLGCRESDGSHRKIIDVYNGITPFLRSAGDDGKTATGKFAQGITGGKGQVGTAATGTATSAKTPILSRKTARSTAGRSAHL